MTDKSVRPTHYIHTAHSLPIPEELAEGLAPKIGAGDQIEFVQSDRAGVPHEFSAWEWMIHFDAAMHKHGAPAWAGAVTKPLWLGSTYIEHGHWSEHFETVTAIVNGELQAYAPRGEYLRFEDNGFLTMSSYAVDQDRWEPGRAADGSEYISFRDNRLGHELAELILIEEEAAEALGIAPVAVAEADVH
jgi:hypothetical protein